MAWSDPAEVDALLTVLRKHGVRAFKSGDLHVELSPAPGEPETPELELDPEMKLLVQDPVIRRLILENRRVERQEG